MHINRSAEGDDVLLSPPPEPSLAVITERIDMWQEAFQDKSFLDFLTATQQADWPTVRELIGRATFVNRCSNGRTPRSWDN